MKRGFTLVELMFASSIGLIVTTALVVMFMSVLGLMKEASDEMQVVLKARALRDRIFYNALTKDGVNYGGLLTARNVFVDTTGVTADLRFAQTNGDPAWLNAQKLGDEFTFEKDSDIGPCGAEIRAKKTLFAYLRVEAGTNDTLFVYKDRLVVPIAGQPQDASTGTDYGALDEDESYYHVKDAVWGKVAEK